MKQISYFILLLLFISSCSSDPTMDAAFSKYADQDGIVSITAPGFLIRTFANFSDLSPEEDELLRHVSKIKVLAVDDRHLYRGTNFYKEFQSKINDDSYTELLTVKEGGNNVKILARNIDDKRICDLLVIVGGHDNALVYIKGDFTTEQIARVANKYRDEKEFSRLARFK